MLWTVVYFYFWKPLCDVLCLLCHVTNLLIFHLNKWDILFLSSFLTFLTPVFHSWRLWCLLVLRSGFDFSDFSGFMSLVLFLFNYFDLFSRVWHWQSVFDCLNLRLVGQLIYILSCLFYLDPLQASHHDSWRLQTWNYIVLISVTEFKCQLFITMTLKPNKSSFRLLWRLHTRKVR